MVGVAPSSDAGELSSTKNPMIKYMLKQRENHAKNQDRDYSHVFRKKTRFEMFRLSAIAMAIEFAYAAETSFVSPILLQIGIDHKVMTMAWGLSPLLGFFLSPLLGSISDRCYLKMGRRRPIITVLSFGILLGLILVPYGKEFGLLLGDEGYTYNVSATIASNFSIAEGSVAALLSPEQEGPSPSNYKYATILTIIGLVLLDFDADTCQTPARTYLLDMCIPEDQPKALTMFTLFAGIGGTIGYGIGGIDWEKTSFGTFLGGNIPTVFGMVTIIFVVCYFITITTFREIPLKLIEKDELLRPLSDAAIKKELKKCNTNVFYIDQDVFLSKLWFHIVFSPEPSLCNSFVLIVLFTNNSQSSPQTIENEMADNNENIPQCQLSKCYTELDECLKMKKPISLAQYLKSIFVMPPSMRILALTNLFCWMGHVTYCLYFTDFVGEAVLMGDQLLVYVSAVGRMSILCFLLFRFILIGYQTNEMVWPLKLFILPVLYTMVWFRIRNGENIPLKQKRGLGTLLPIISSVVFIAQLIGFLVYRVLSRAWDAQHCAFCMLRHFCRPLLPFQP
ncbi:Membrane-associated transporter protein [Lucilia cuprina]|nr:Membrane-associated transporter protein [Lucilia cuprina]